MRMGFCKIERAAPGLLNPIPDAGLAQHAPPYVRAVILQTAFPSLKNPRAVHPPLRSTTTDRTYAQAR
jgi:hypothetical protein